MNCQHFEEEFKGYIRRRYDRCIFEAIGYLEDAASDLKEIPREFLREDILDFIYTVQTALKLVYKRDIFKGGMMYDSLCL